MAPACSPLSLQRRLGDTVRCLLHFCGSQLDVIQASAQDYLRERKGERPAPADAGCAPMAPDSPRKQRPDAGERPWIHRAKPANPDKPHAHSIEAPQAAHKRKREGDAASGDNGTTRSPAQRGTAPPLAEPGCRREQMPSSAISCKRKLAAAGLGHLATENVRTKASGGRP